MIKFHLWNLDIEDILLTVIGFINKIAASYDFVWKTVSDAHPKTSASSSSKSGED